jgi:uncharacterized membrane protein
VIIWTHFWILVSSILALSKENQSGLGTKDFFVINFVCFSNLILYTITLSFLIFTQEALTTSDGPGIGMLLALVWPTVQTVLAIATVVIGILLYFLSNKIKKAKI